KGKSLGLYHALVGDEVTSLKLKPDERLLTSSPTIEKRGKLQLITAFATDHPEFQLVAEKLPDPDTLKFNHQLHLTSPTIPQLPDGKKLECASCHQPDASGAFYRKISFDANC